MIGHHEETWRRRGARRQRWIHGWITEVVPAPSRKIPGTRWRVSMTRGDSLFATVVIGDEAHALARAEELTNALPSVPDWEAPNG